MLFYAIKQTSTGYYMPYRKYSKGFTADEPKKDCIPRLFSRRRDAIAALKCWLQGKWEMKYYYGPDDWGLDIKKQPNRNVEDMEVVTLCFYEATVVKEKA